MPNPTAEEIAAALAAVQAAAAAQPGFVAAAHANPMMAPPQHQQPNFTPGYGGGGPPAWTKGSWKGGGGGGGGKGWGKAPVEWTALDWGVPGFGEALYEALEPYIDMEPGSSLDDLAVKVGTKIIKAAKKFNTDERMNQRGTSTQAKVLIESFVETCMAGVSASFGERPWFGKANLSGPLLASALFTFSGAKVFTRTLAPMLELFVQEGLFKWAEEERIDAGIDTALEMAGVHGSHRKKAKKHLQTGFDEAHMKAPYGSTTAETTEMCMLQDFVKGWMSDFIHRGYDVMCHGIGGGTGNPTRDECVLFATVLFQHLTSPENACLPSDLTALIETPPPCPWPFVAETAEAIFHERESEQQEFKRARKFSMGCYMGKGADWMGKAGGDPWGGKGGGDPWGGKGGWGGGGKGGDPWGGMGKGDMWGGKGWAMGKGKW